MMLSIKEIFRKIQELKLKAGDLIFYKKDQSYCLVLDIIKWEGHQVTSFCSFYLLIGNKRKTVDSNENHFLKNIIIVK